MMPNGFHKWVKLGLCALVMMFTATRWAAAGSLLEQVESPYNSIFVYSSGDYVELTFGHSGQRYLESMRNTTDLLELPVPYTRAMTAALAYPDDLGAIAMIGMGGGSISWYLHKHMADTQILSVELDPQMIRLSEKYFQLRPEKNFRIANADGRVFLRKRKDKFDIIMVDAYRGPFVPFHLLTREFYALAKTRLRPGGVLAQNIEPSTMLFDSAHATMLAVFDQVDFYRAGGNVIAVAYDGAHRLDAHLAARAAARQSRFKFRYDLRRIVASRRQLAAPGATVKILSDDFAPVNVLKSIKVHNRKWQ